MGIVEGEITAAENKGLYLAGDVKRRMLKEDSADFVRVRLITSLLSCSWYYIYIYIYSVCALCVSIFLLW